MKIRKCRLLTLALLVFSAAVSVRAEDLDASAQKGSAFFDGASRYAAASAQVPSPQLDKAGLLVELKKRVTINDRGVPAEGAALNAVLARMMDSPTARDLADKFIKEDAKAEVSFEEIPNTVIFEINGRKEFWASGGYTDTANNPPKVNLNSAYMAAGSTDQTPEKVLAHEMFGHALERKRAERYGMAEVYLRHQNEEANAGLIGWTVDAELGNKITDSWAWIYMADPDDYHKQLKSNSAYYAGTLNTEEMKNPRAAYEKRLADTERLLLRVPVRKENNEIWLKRIEHLITSHKMNPSSFLTLKEEISVSLKGIPGMEANLQKIKKYLQHLIAFCDGENGAAWTANLAAQFDNAYFREKEQKMEERRQVLAGLMLGKNRQSESPPERPGQISWDQLKELWEKDTKSGCGGKL